MYLYHVGFVERYNNSDLVIGSLLVILEHEISTFDDLNYIRKKVLEISKTDHPIIISMNLVSSSFTDNF